jgi:competence protein ComFB
MAEMENNMSSSFEGIVNYNEEVVSHYIELLLAERDDICTCQRCRLDVMAFACNRVQPRYIASERGHTHAYLDRHNTQNQADIISIVAEGIEIVSSRTRHFENSDIKAETTEQKKDSLLYFNFPHIVGTVRDADNLESVSGVTVTSFIDGKKAWLSDDSWSNPYKTIKATLGTYSFWFAPETCSNNETRKFRIRITFDNENYLPSEKVFYLNLEPESTKYQYIRHDNLYIVPTVYLEKNIR